MTDSTAGRIAIQRIGTLTMRVPVIGTAPYICHRWSEKAKRQMLDSQQGRKSPKVSRDPAEDYQGAFYRLDDDAYAIPTLAFKAATIGAARYFDKSVPMTQLRMSLFFDGETNKSGELLNRLTDHTEPFMREDVVRVGMGTDLRFRPQFNEWSTVLDIRFVPSMLSQDSVIALIDAGGMGLGVGENRPEKGKAGGQYGTFMVDPDRAVEMDA